MTTRRDIALNSNAWPMQEARKILKRYEKEPPKKGYVLFETGYGPSGLPHIGTFCEVARTTSVMRAFKEMSDLPTRLFCFSDDMDGLRKVPDNVPNREEMANYIGQPLTKVPDPFRTHNSFGEHNNARLMAFLDEYGFDYEFQSSTQYYHSGKFDDAIKQIMRHNDQIMDIMLPSLREERRKTYSPFLPVCPKTGAVLQVPIIDMDVEAGTVSYKDDAGNIVSVPVTGGQCKLQWKVDWAMRWVALGVDYEMSGKDLTDSVRLSSQICKVLGGNPPDGFNYELFLDENGNKISKSKGNGLSMDDWLHYGPEESLALYVFQNPRRAKKLHFDIIPKAVDEYYTFLEKYPEQEDNLEKLFQNPLFYMHKEKPEQVDLPVSFALLLNLVGTTNTEDPKIIWDFVSGYTGGANPKTHPELDRLIGYALHYYKDFVLPTRKYRKPSEGEVKALSDLVAILEKLPKDTKGEDIQTAIYDIGNNHKYENLRDWFKALYETLLGQEQGPRMGHFIALLGIDDSLTLINKAISGELSQD